MKPRQPHRHRRTPPLPEEGTLPAPPGLEATTFSVDDDEYVLLSFPFPDVELPPGLTKAEREVVRGVLEGLSNAQIARARNSSTNTVANQLCSVYAKLGVSGRLGLARRCASSPRSKSRR